MPHYNIKISKVRIKNFRKFDKLDLDLAGKGYTCLAGRNGSGKTAVLEAINLAFSERSSKLTEVIESDFYSEEPIEVSVELANPFFFGFEHEGYLGLIPCTKFTRIIKRRDRKENGQFFSTEYHASTKYQVDDYSPTPAEFQALKEQIEDVKPDNFHLVREFRKGIAEEGGGYRFRVRSDRVGEFRELPFDEAAFNYEFPQFNISKVLFPKVFYFNKDRDRELLTQYNTALSDVVRELNWRFKRELIRPRNSTKKDDLLSSFESIQSGIVDLDDSKDKILDPAISILRDNFGLEVDHKLDFFVFNPYQPFSKSILGFVTDSNQMVSTNQLGSGVTILIALAVSVSFSLESRNPIIVLIDEPELHLHSDLQKNVFRFLNQAQFQSMVATHSHLFLDRETISNNFVLHPDGVMRTSALDLADVQFRLLGNSVSDLYIPERILIVEGKHDREMFLKGLDLLGYSELNIQIISAGGNDKIPHKSDRYQAVIDEILGTSKWYSNYINKHLKIIVDGDVSVDRVEYWKAHYNLDGDKQIYHIRPDREWCLENLFPESLIKICVKETALADGRNLSDLSTEEIIDVICADDKLDDKSKCVQASGRVSKSRLNQFILEHLDKAIIESPESEDFKKLIDWVSADII